MISLFLYKNSLIQEHFSSDEAVQNIASLYNQAKMTVTDFVSTGTANYNNLNITGTATMPTLNSTNINATSNIKGDNLNISKGITSATITTGPITAGKSTFADTSITGSLNVAGIVKPLTEQAFVVNTDVWDQSKWIAYITQQKYFNRNMPDGIILKFLFVYDNKNGNVSYSYCNAIKIGNQFMFTQVKTENGLANPATNTSSDLNWRGNIN